MVDVKKAVDDPNAELSRRLKEARKKVESFEEESRKREEIRELERKVRFEENKARDLPHIEAAEEEHGVIKVVNTPLGAIVLKRPHHLAFQKFMRRVNSEKGMNEKDIWRLTKPCIVYPDVNRVDEITEEYPGVSVRMGSKVVELGNGRVEDVEGK